MSRGDLIEAEWRALKGLLPIEPENRGRGGRPEQNCSDANGILWRLRRGAPWRDVPPSNRIARMFGHLKINRAIAARYDHIANSFLGMVHLATARYRLKFVRTV